MNHQLDQIAAQLRQAQTPEEIFGKVPASREDCLAAIKKSYRTLAKVIHPDLYLAADEKKMAHAAFEQLLRWLQLAEEKARLGIYGQNQDGPKQIFLQSRLHLYCVEDQPVVTPFFAEYPCSFDDAGRKVLASIKIVRDPHQNNISQNEIQAIKVLQASPEVARFAAYIPELIEAFIYQDEDGEHQASVFARYTGWYSFEDIRHSYPDGIHPRDMAWMFRRLMVALGFAHRSGLTHGDVTPGNVYILPEEHGLMLANWSASTSATLDPAANAREDISAAVRCMLFLLGGDPQQGISPEALPQQLKSFFKGSLLPGTRAPQDAWALKQEFDELIERLWGKRTYHPFIMKFPNT
jgi:curved DNA-binding protein CbpA